MAVVRIRRSGRLSSSIALVLVLAALVALGWWSQQPASGGGGGAGGTPGATQQQQQQQTRGGGGGTGGSSSSSSRVSAWADVPEVSLSVQLPSWAGCPQPPCQYGQMADGAANTSVSDWNDENEGGLRAFGACTGGLSGVERRGAMVAHPAAAALARPAGRIQLPVWRGRVALPEPVLQQARRVLR